MSSNTQEKPIRSVVKALSYRIVGSVSTAVISFLITGNTHAAISIGVVEFLSKFALFYGHERMWNRINFGRIKARVEYEI